MIKVTTVNLQNDIAECSTSFLFRKMIDFSKIRANSTHLKCVSD